MLIDTQTIGTSPKEFDVVIPVAEIDLQSEGDELTADVAMKGEAKSVDGMVEVDGTLETQLNVGCRDVLNLSLYR